MLVRQKTQGNTTLRHTLITQVLHELCERVGCHVEREAPVEMRMDDDLKDIKGGDLLEGGRIYLWVTTHEASYYVDVSVVHPLADTHQQLDSKNSSKARARQAAAVRA